MRKRSGASGLASTGATIFRRSMGTMTRASAIEAGNWKRNSRTPARCTVKVNTIVSSTLRSVTRTWLIVSQVTSAVRGTSFRLPR